ncbi:MAG: SgcJ/EcaC family oxidoreductase [Cyclobacteriaceae bacterium]
MNITTKILVLNSLFFLNSCDEVDSSADIEAIESMSKARAKAFNEGDAKTIASYFAEDAILMAPEQPPMKGPDQVEVYYQSIFDQYDTELSSHYDEVEVSGDLAFGRGTAEVRLKPKKGDSVITSVSKYLNILQKQPNGEWLTTHDIWNSNQ